MAKKPATSVPGTAVSTKVARASVAIPANAQELMDADVAALSSKLAAPTGRSINVTQSKQFRFPDSTTVDTFKGIIVSFVSHNAYYEGEFDRDNLVPPNCFAIGVVKNDDLDCAASSPDPQNGVEGDCRTCPMNQWESAPKGKGKACKNQIKLGVLCADGEIRPMTLSSTALKPFGEYVRNVAQSFGVAPYGVMTTFTFDPKFDYSSVRCGDPLPLNKEQMGQAFMAKDDAHAMISIEPDVSEFDEKVASLRDKPKGKAKAKPLQAAKGKAGVRP